MLRILMNRHNDIRQCLWLCIALVFSITLPACDAGTLPESEQAKTVKTSATPDAFQSFVPAGWRLEKTISHDIDKDGLDDAVLILIKASKGKDADAGERTLIVLMGDKGGNYHKTATARRLLICDNCAGMMGGFDAASAYVDFEDDLLVISWIAGSRWTKETVLRFGYNVQTKRMVLLSDSVEQVDRNVGEESIIKTQRDFVNGIQKVNDKRSTIKKQLIFIDDVNSDDYGFNK